MSCCPCHHTIEAWVKAGIDPSKISDGGNPNCIQCKTDPTGLYHPDRQKWKRDVFRIGDVNEVK